MYYEYGNIDDICNFVYFMYNKIQILIIEKTLQG